MSPADDHLRSGNHGLRCSDFTKGQIGEMTVSISLKREVSRLAQKRTQLRPSELETEIRPCSAMSLCTGMTRSSSRINGVSAMGPGRRFQDG